MFNIAPYISKVNCKKKQQLTSDLFIASMYELYMQPKKQLSFPTAKHNSVLFLWWMLLVKTMINSE